MKKALLAAGIAVLVIGAGAFFFGRAALFSLVLFFGQSPGHFDRARYEAIVARAGAMSIAPGQTLDLRLPDPGDPTSLRPRLPGEGDTRGRGAGNVWARRTPAGKLQVVIETRDLGHAGEYGFAYSEEVLSPSPFGGGWLSIDVPSHLTLLRPDMQIDDHWWEVLYNLD